MNEQKQQAFDNFAIVCAIVSESIDDKKIPFEAGWDAAIETVLKFRTVPSMPKGYTAVLYEEILKLKK